MPYGPLGSLLDDEGYDSYLDDAGSSSQGAASPASSSYRPIGGGWSQLQTPEDEPYDWLKEYQKKHVPTSYKPPEPEKPVAPAAAPKKKAEADKDKAWLDDTNKFLSEHLQAQPSDTDKTWLDDTNKFLSEQLKAPAPPSQPAESRSWLQRAEDVIFGKPAAQPSTAPTPPPQPWEHFGRTAPAAPTAPTAPTLTPDQVQQLQPKWSTAGPAPPSPTPPPPAPAPPVPGAPAQLQPWEHFAQPPAALSSPPPAPFDRDKGLATLQGLVQQHQSLKQQFDEQNAAVQKPLAALDASQKALAATKDALDADQASFEKQYPDAPAKVQRFDAANAALTKPLTALTEQKQQLDAAGVTAQRARDAFDAHYKAWNEAGRPPEQADALRQEQTQLNQQVDAYNQQQTAYNAHVTQLQPQLDAVKQLATELQPIQQTQAKLNARAKDYNARLAAGQQQYQAIQPQIAKLQAMQGQSEALRNQILPLQQQLNAPTPQGWIDWAHGKMATGAGLALATSAAIGETLNPHDPRSLDPATLQVRPDLPGHEGEVGPAPQAEGLGGYFLRKLIPQPVADIFDRVSEFGDRLQAHVNMALAGEGHKVMPFELINPPDTVHMPTDAEQISRAEKGLPPLKPYTKSYAEMQTEDTARKGMRMLAEMATDPTMAAVGAAGQVPYVGKAIELLFSADGINNFVQTARNPLSTPSDIFISGLQAGIQSGWLAADVGDAAIGTVGQLTRDGILIAKLNMPEFLQRPIDFGGRIGSPVEAGVHAPVTALERTPWGATPPATGYRELVTGPDGRPQWRFVETGETAKDAFTGAWDYARRGGPGTVDTRPFLPWRNEVSLGDFKTAINREAAVAESRGETPNPKAAVLEVMDRKIDTWSDDLKAQLQASPTNWRDMWADALVQKLRPTDAPEGTAGGATAGQRRFLSERGYSTEDIDKMTPAEASAAILNPKEAPAPAPPDDFIFTLERREQLYQRGYTTADIDAMKPHEAEAALQKPTIQTKQALVEKGYSQADADKMTVEQANRALSPEPGKGLTATFGFHQPDATGQTGTPVYVVRRDEDQRIIGFGGKETLEKLGIAVPETPDYTPRTTTPAPTKMPWEMTTDELQKYQHTGWFTLQRVPPPGKVDIPFNAMTRRYGLVIDGQRQPGDFASRADAVEQAHAIAGPGDVLMMRPRAIYALTVDGIPAPKEFASRAEAREYVRTAAPDAKNVKVERYAGTPEVAAQLDPARINQVGLHRALVEYALGAGQAVPAHVLAQYPDLPQHLPAPTSRPAESQPATPQPPTPPPTPPTPPPAAVAREPVTLPSAPPRKPLSEWTDADWDALAERAHAEATGPQWKEGSPYATPENGPADVLGLVRQQQLDRKVEIERLRRSLPTLDPAAREAAGTKMTQLQDAYTGTWEALDNHMTGVDTKALDEQTTAAAHAQLGPEREPAPEKPAHDFTVGDKVIHKRRPADVTGVEPDGRIHIEVEGEDGTWTKKTVSPQEIVKDPLSDAEHEELGTLMARAESLVGGVDALPDKDWARLQELENRLADAMDASQGEPGYGPKVRDYELGEDRLPPEEVFPSPTSTVRFKNLDSLKEWKKREKEGYFITPEEAAKRVASWKAEAQRLGKTEDNSKKVIYSLFDRTGVWSQPFRDAGYTVRTYDLKHGQDLLQFFPTADIIADREAGYEIVGVLAGPPCPSFSSSGARWWETKHDQENQEHLEKIYGFAASKEFKTPLDYAVTLVNVVKAFVEFAAPTRFHVLENPVGRINTSVGAMPRKPTLTFQPAHFGDPYTKKTQLWGVFNTDLPTAPVYPTEGSFIQNTLRGDDPTEQLERSATPEGFAYAFFMANRFPAEGEREPAPEAQAPTLPHPPTEPPPVIAFRSGNQIAPADIVGYIQAGQDVGVTADMLDSVRAPLIEHVAKGGHAFIDSGAYGTTKMAADGRGVPTVNFDAILDTYHELADAVDKAGGDPEHLYVVAPDVAPARDTTGRMHTFPRETSELQAQYAPRIDALMDRGLKVIVPVQLGRDDYGEPDTETFTNDLIEAVTRFPGARIGLPGNKGAVPPEVLTAALTALQESPVAEDFGGVHFLGVGDRGRAAKKLAGLVDTVRAVFPDVDITSDATRSTALFAGNRPAQRELLGRLEWLAAGAADEAVDDMVLTTGIAGDFFSGDWEDFTPEELKAIFDAGGVSSSEAYEAKENGTLWDLFGVQAIEDRARENFRDGMKIADDVAAYRYTLDDKASSLPHWDPDQEYGLLEAAVQAIDSDWSLVLAMTNDTLRDHLDGIERLREETGKYALDELTSNLKNYNTPTDVLDRLEPILDRETKKREGQQNLFGEPVAPPDVTPDPVVLALWKIARDRALQDQDLRGQARTDTIATTDVKAPERTFAFGAHATWANHPAVVGEFYPDHPAGPSYRITADGVERIVPATELTPAEAPKPEAPTPPVSQPPVSKPKVPKPPKAKAGTAWMNEADIEQAVERFKDDPVLGPAARFLDAFKDQVNAHSDGWPYWSQPGKAAGKLQALLYGHLMAGMGAYPVLPKATSADVRATLGPIKAFMTKKGIKAGMTLPTLELPADEKPAPPKTVDELIDALPTTPMHRALPADTRLYHGTQQDFGDFNLDTAVDDPIDNGDSLLYGPGHYLTDSADIASSYAAGELAQQHGREDVTGANVRPVRVDIQRAFDIDAPLNNDGVRAILDAVTNALGQPPETVGRAPVTTPEQLYAEWDAIDAERDQESSPRTGETLYDWLKTHFMEAADVNNVLRDAGYDGITHIGGELTGGPSHRVWIAFTDAQVQPWFGTAPEAPPVVEPESLAEKARREIEEELRKQIAEMKRRRAEDKALNRPADGSGETTEEEIELEINKDRLLDLLDARMYENPILEVATKELLQNAFDAVRQAGATDKNPGHITITFDRGKRNLTITDDGIGMTPAIIKKAFFTVAGTHKEGKPENTSGGLGLAKMAFLLGSSRVRVETTRDGNTSIVDTTAQEIRSKKIVVSTTTTGRPSGTTVSIWIPETYTDQNGEKQEIYLSPEPYFLKNALIGPVEVTFNGRSEPIGTKLEGYKKENEFHFDWGTINVYVDPTPQRRGNGEVRVLSAGLHQFFHYPFSADTEFKYNILLDVRPKVRAGELAYPFNNSRENWRPTIKSDIEAMNAFLQRMALQEELLEAKDSFSQLQKLPEIDISKKWKAKDLAKLQKQIEEQRRRAQEQTGPVARTPRTVTFTPSNISITYSDNKTEQVDRAEYVKESFKPKKNVDFAATGLDVSNMNPSEPLLHNNTNAKLDDIDGLTPLFTEIGNVLVKFMREWGERVGGRYAELADTSPAGWFGGISIDKSYRGLNMIKPFKGIWLNPALLSYDGMRSAAGAASELLHLIIHEITHVAARSEGADFTAELATNHARIRTAQVPVEYYEQTLAKMLDARWAALVEAHERVESYDTKNRAASFQSSAAAGPDRSRPTGEDPRVSEVDAARAERVQEPGRAGDRRAETPDRKGRIGDLLYGHLDAPEPSLDDVRGMAKILRLYTQLGVTDFPTVVRRFQQDYGTNARGLDRALQASWRMMTGHDLRVGDVLDRISVAPFTLPAPQADVQARAIADLEANPVAYKREYLNRFGPVLNADNASELFPDYAGTPESRATMVAAVRAPAGALINAILDDMLAQPKDVRPDVLFFAGGNGAGKTSAIKLAEQQEGRPVSDDHTVIVMDSTLSNYATSKANIEKVLASGRHVGIGFVWRDPLKALDSALKRAMNPEEGNGRTVTIRGLAQTTIGARDTVLRLAKEYAGNPRVDIGVLENAEGPEPLERDLAWLQTKTYDDRDALEARLSAALESAHSAGTISDAVYNGFRGLRPPAKAPQRDETGVPGERGASEGEPGEAGAGVADEDRDVAGGEGGEPGAVGPGGHGPTAPGTDAGTRPGVPQGPEPRSGEGADAGGTLPGPNEDPGLTPPLYIITDADAIGTGTPHERVANNFAAIRIIKQLEAEQRQATPEEQQALVKYVGWGGLSRVFEYWKNEPDEEGEDPEAANKYWYRQQQALSELLTDEEYRAAKNSTQNAHYTSPTVIRAMWAAVQHLGVKDGSALEPAAGIGHFLGLMPPALRGTLTWALVEKDPMTARIAAALYPSAYTQNAPYETTKLPTNHFTVSISNVPFGKIPITDRLFAGPPFVRKRIHNYYFGKTLDNVAPGGLIAFVTTHGTLDARDSQRVREYLAGRADFLGAIRLPYTAFKTNARTEVVTDIIFLRKRHDGEVPQHVAPWMESKPMSLANKEGAAVEHHVNEYFHAHPEMVLGDQNATGKQRQGDEYNVTPPGEKPAEQLKHWNANGADQLARAIANLPANVIDTRPPKQTLTDFVSAQAPPGTRPFEYLMHDGQLAQIVDGRVVPVTEMTKADMVRIQAMLPIRAALRKAYDLMAAGAGEPEWKAAQRGLEKAYDAFVKKHGFLSQEENFEAFAEDPDLPLLLSLEDWDPETEKATKTAIFKQRTMEAERRARTADSPAQALHLTLGELGRVDLDRAGELLGVTPEQAGKQLQAAGLILDTPSGWQLPAQYLSGNVRVKLAEAEAAAAMDARYAPAADALKAVVPADIPAHLINVRLGASWVPPEVVTAFVAHLVNARIGNLDWKITYSNADARWHVEGEPRAHSSSIETPEVRTKKLLLSALNDTRITVWTKATKDTPRRVNEEATALARARRDELNRMFVEWLFNDDKDRREWGVRTYNDRFNALVEPTIDGSYLTFPGMADYWRKRIRPHQQNAVARVLQFGNTLFAHVVGAGKTLAMIASGMELRRMGLARKPLYVVPNHLLAQWSSEFLQYYPNAKIMVARPTDLNAENRKRFTARIASGDWDAIIMPISMFTRVSMSPEAESAYHRDLLDSVEQAIIEAWEAEGGERRGQRPPTVKRLENMRDRIQGKLDDLANRPKDEMLSFEQLGVDALLADEAHFFKNLYFPTRQQNVAGIPADNDADRATDMYLKVRYINQLSNYRNVVLATGTPVSNSMAEIFVMQKLLQEEVLKQANIDHFDAWLTQFGVITNELELDPTGTGMSTRTRLANYSNLQRLAEMFKQVADVKMIDDLPGLKAARPPLRDGKSETIVVPATPEQLAFLQSLVDRADRLDPRTRHLDNMAMINGDGRLGMLDMRLLDRRTPDNPGNKMHAVAHNVADIYHQNKDRKGTQLVFIDRGTPGSEVRPAAKEVWDPTVGARVKRPLTEAEKMRGYNLYADLKKKLITLGIPGGEIAFIHDIDKLPKKKQDAARRSLFRQVKDGRVRVLIGSSDKMGTGMNVQDRLVAEHNVDPTYKPSETEQREGRILRQGNKFATKGEPEYDPNFNVRILNYVTQGVGMQFGLDAYMWQLNEAKAKFIARFFKGDVTDETMKLDLDNTVLTAGEMKAAATGNPLIMELGKAEQALYRLELARTGFQEQQRQARWELQSAKQSLAHYQKDIADNEQLLALLTPAPESPTAILNGEEVVSQKLIGQGLLAEVSAVIDKSHYYTPDSYPSHVKPVALGTFRGLTIWLYGSETGPRLTLGHPEDTRAGSTGSDYERFGSIELRAHKVVTDDKGVRRLEETDWVTPEWLGGQLGYALRSGESTTKAYRAYAKEKEQEVERYEKILSGTFHQETEYAAAVARLEAIRRELGIDEDDNEPDNIVGTDDEGDPMAVGPSTNIFTGGAPPRRPKVSTATPPPTGPEPTGLTAERPFGERLSELMPAIRALIAPDALGAAAAGAAGTIRHEAAVSYRELAKANEALRAFGKRVEKLSRADAIRYWDDAENGRLTGDPDLDAGNALLRLLTEKFTQELVALDKLKAEAVRENYVGRFWNPDPENKLPNFLGRILGRRPLEGPKSFMKQRTWESLAEGLNAIRDAKARIAAGKPQPGDERIARMRPATYNWVTSQLAKMAEMQRVIAAEKMLRYEEAAGRLKRVMDNLGHEPPVDENGEKWIRVGDSNDPAFTIFGPKHVTVKEAFDEKLMGMLHKFAQALGVTHVRKIRTGKNTWGYAVGDRYIATKFGGPEGVLMHEIGHIIDNRYGLAKKWVNNKKMADELRKLADLREEGTPSISSSRRKYLHKGAEKIANLVHAFLYMPEQAKAIAPNAFKALNDLAMKHKELAPLLDIQKNGRGLKFGVNEAQQEIPGFPILGHVYAPKAAAAVWKNHLSRGLRGNPLFDAYQSLGNASAQLLLGMSGFHLMTIAREGINSRVALTIDAIANRGKTMTLTEKTRHLIAAIPAAVTDAAFGRRVMQEYLTPGLHPQLAPVLDAMMAGGFRGTAESDWWTGEKLQKLKDRFEKWWDAAKEGDLKGVLKGWTLPFDAVWAGLEQTLKPLMAKYVPWMKTAATYNAAAQALKSLPENASIDDLRAAMWRIVKEMDFRYGQVVYDNHFIDRTVKDAAQALLLAPGWTFGTLALAARGVKQGVQVPYKLWKLAKGEPVEELVGPSAGYWFGAMLVLGLINGFITWLMTGENPHGKDFFAYRDGTIDDDGDANRHILPGYEMRDIYGWRTHPFQTAMNKLSPPLTWGGRLLANRTYYGDLMYDPEGTYGQFFKDVGKSAWANMGQPFSVSNYLEARHRGSKGFGSALQNAMGISPAKREFERSDAENLAAEYMSRRGHLARTPDQVEQADKRRELQEAYKRGDKTTVRTIERSGVLSKAQLKTAETTGKETFLQRSFKQFTIDEAINVYEAATSAERYMLHDRFVAKEKLIEAAPEEEQADLRKRYAAASKLPQSKSRPAVSRPAVSLAR